jgi:hypothetical protein
MDATVGLVVFELRKGRGFEAAMLSKASRILMPSDAKIPAVGCSFVQFGEKRCFRKLHGNAHLCTALKTRGRFDSLHPLHLP